MTAQGFLGRMHRFRGRPAGWEARAWQGDPTTTLLFLARFLTGVGQGTYFGNDRPVIAAYTPPGKMGFGQGVFFTGLGMGMAIGISMAGVIADHWGWRMVFVAFAVPSLAAGLVVWRKIQEPPRGAGVVLQRWMWLLLLPFPLLLLAGLAADRALLRWVSLLFPAAFLLCLVRWLPGIRKADLWLTYFAGIAPIYYLWVVGIWAPAMFIELGVTEQSRSSLLSSLLGVSAVPGLLLAGVVSDRLARRGKGRKGIAALILLGMAVSMLCMGVAVQARAHPVVLASLVFAAGLCIWGVWAPVFALLAELTPAHLQGTSFGLNNTLNFIGSLVAPIATGWIKDVSGSLRAHAIWRPRSAWLGPSSSPSSVPHSAGPERRRPREPHCGFGVAELGLNLDLQSAIFNPR